MSNAPASPPPATREAPIALRRPHILVAYHTLEGQSEKIARSIAETLRQQGADSDAIAVPDVPTTLHAYDGVVVGGSIHGGALHRQLLDFLRRHRDELASRPSAFFSVSLTAGGKDERARKDLSAIVDRALAKVEWRPDDAASFAGTLAYSRYNFLVRFIMKRIAGAQGGSTDTSKDTEYTDWDAVAAFAAAMYARVLAAAPPSATSAPAPHRPPSRTRYTGRQ